MPLPIGNPRVTAHSSAAEHRGEEEAQLQTGYVDPRQISEADPQTKPNLPLIEIPSQILR
jgi:hypothetical protein